MTTPIIDGSSLEQLQTALNLQDFTELILPKHMAFSDTLTTNIPSNFDATIHTIPEGSSFPVDDYTLTTQKLTAVKHGSMLVMTKQMIRSSATGTVAWLTHNIKAGMNKMMIENLEVLFAPVAMTALDTELAKYNHLSGGIVYISNNKLNKTYAGGLPAGWTAQLAPISNDVMVVPNGGLAVIATDLVLEESTDAAVNMISDNTAGITPTVKTTSLYQIDAVGFKWSLMFAMIKTV
jgi:hypothetical protein